ncbi:hypothetical protein [Kangiella koreensis]|uniref:VanZ-like domain-containing protein n=1 Tax=Kangiella koreensis (strain DSM 16069 / JCM 12317 / KCTC 12182 / SW-125) TaxID=523791 RepID=C7RB64_KANKD|nr:hypothetical protein [Kangiella koreensis]ACV26506.1 hypothetical protein Kkor_1087 [Kangiella koreensis DSM 16069]
MHIRYILWLLFIGVQVAIGIIIYAQSGEDVAGFVWFARQFPSLSAWLFELISHFPLLYREGWIANHLPDILWSSACASFLVGLWVTQLTLSKLLPLGMGCAIFYETLQGLGFAGGTFDWLDWIYSLCAGVLSTLLTYLLLNKSTINDT